MQTESNHDTALTLACAGGHEELVSVLIARGANIEHRDKKGKLQYQNSLTLSYNLKFGVPNRNLGFLASENGRGCKNNELHSGASRRNIDYVNQETLYGILSLFLKEVHLSELAY